MKRLRSWLFLRESFLWKRSILEADRQRARQIIPFLERDERTIVRLYFLWPMKETGELRTWQEIEELMHLSHTAVMQRRRKLMASVDRIIEERGL